MFRSLKISMIMIISSIDITSCHILNKYKYYLLLLLSYNICITNNLISTTCYTPLKGILKTLWYGGMRPWRSFKPTVFGQRLFARSDYMLSKKKKKKGIKTSSIILIHQKNITYLLIAKHYPYRKILLSAPTKLTKSHNNFHNILPTILLAPPFPRIPTRFNQRNHIHLLSPMVIPFQHVRSSPCLGRCTFSSAKMSSLVSE